MVKNLHSSMLKIAMAVLALSPVGLCFNTQTVSAQEATTAVKAVITPAEGNVEELQSFSITFEGVTTVETVSITSPTLAPTVSGNGHNYYAMSASADGNVLSFKTQANPDGYGEYTLTVPGALYTLDGAQGETLTFTYNKVKTAKALEYTITPAADEDGNVSTISPIVVTFPNATESVAENPNADYYSQYAYIEYNSPKAGWCGIEFDEVQLQNKSILFFVSEQDQIAGQFKLTIPAGTYLVDGDENPEIVQEFNYVIPTQDYANAVIDPAEGEVESLQSFTIEFTNATEVTTEISQSAYPQLYNVTKDSREAAFTAATVEGNKMTLKLGGAITNAGQYELRIPGNCYYLDSIQGLDLTFAYTVVTSAKTIEYTVAPEADEEGNISDISALVVKFPNAAAVTANPASTDYALVEYASEKSKESWVELPSTVELQSNSILVFLEDQDKISGTFRLTIPAATYLVDGVESPEIVETFNYVKPVDKTEFQVLADGIILSGEGVVLEAIDESVVVEFPNATEVAYDENDWQVYPAVQYNDPDYGWSDAYGLEPAYAEDNKLTFERSSWVSSLEGGDYRVLLPAGKVYLDGDTITSDLAFTFSIKVEVPEFTTKITPAEGNVSSLKNFDIVFYGVTLLRYNYDSNTQYYIEDKDGNRTTSSDAYVNYDEESGECPLHIEFAEITADGEYTLVLPAGSYKVNGVSGEELRFNFTVVNSTDAVKSIFVDGVQSVDVYDLRGVRVLSNAKAEDIQNLKTAIYVINGHKYLIRK
jgi:hypothetical protein